MNNNIKIMLGLFLALSIILPANVMSPQPSKTSDLDNTTQNSIGSLPVIESKTIKNDECMYKAWVGGELHYTKIYYQTSKDEGSRWSDAKPITDEDYTPVSVELLKNKKTLHLIWEDGTQRAFTTYYMKSDDDGATWSKPLNVGFKNPKMVLDNNIIYILSTTPDKRMSVSRSEDEGNIFLQVEPDTDFSSFINDIMVNDGCMHIAFSGGIREPETGTHSDTGIYYMFSKDGIHWDNAVKVSDVEAPVNSVSIKNDNNLLSVKWTEDKERECLTYIKSSLNGISWNKKEIVDAVEVPQQNHNPIVSSGTKAAEKVDKEWTFICYLDADNNLYNYGKEDMNEMEMIGSNANINIVVLMDLNANGDTKAYYVQQDADTGTITSPEIPLTNINASWGTELNMGNPQTCIDFVNYVYTNYPAKKYAMDFWNHGGSWKYGMCSDDTNSDDFTMLEVRTIFETLRAQTGREILWDVCGYDECLMSDVSVDYDEKPYINYILNSEDSIGGDGWEYNYVLGHLNDNPTMDAETFAYWIYYSYGERYGTSGSLTTMSVINCTEFDYVLMPAINNLGQKLRHKAVTLNSNIKTAATNSASWQGYTHQRDLVNFCQNLQTQIPSATDPEIYNAAQKVIDIAQANTFGDAPWNATWNHSKPILCHNQNTGENGVTIYCTEASYDTTYDTLRMAPETSWDDAVKAVIANTADYPNEEPACSITAPSEGSYVVLNAIATVTGNANDNADAGTVQKVEVKIDREAWQTATGTTSWTFDWDTVSWAPGSHKIFARAYDGTDYSETWVCRNVEIIVDPTLSDLTLSSSDVMFDNPSPNEGDLVKINATVYNVNTRPDAQNANDVEIGFYDGNPSSGGTLIGIVPATPSLIEPGNSGWGEITWNTAGLAGWHNIYVVADPNHTVAELTDSNNTAMKTMPVTGYGVVLSCPANSSTIQAGASANYEIVVRNTGTYTDSFELTIDNPTDWNANFNDNPAKRVKEGEAFKAEYHNYTTATNELQNIAANYPSITKLYSIGKSWENRDIWAVKVSDNPEINETDEPDVLYMGMHHAREWMTVEIPIYFLNYLVNNYGTDPEVTYFVNNRELWIIPMVNPDGYDYSRNNDSSWRKNRRDNGDSTFGVDLNRNYDGSQNGDSSGAWSGAGASDITSADTYCGPSPFSEPETLAIRDLVITHAGNGNKFILSVSYHSYAQEIYYPWGYATSGTLNTPDWQLQHGIAENLSAYNGYTVMQSGDTYLTTGDSDDWIYGYSKYVLGNPTYPFTIEVDTSFQPPTSQIPITCEKHVDVNLYLAEVADNPAQEYPKITHTPLPDTKNTTEPYRAIATITSDTDLNTSALKLVWKTGTTSDTTVTLSLTGNPDEYYADIPGQPDGTWVYYYIYTEDSGGNKSISPETKKWESQNYYKFYVGEDRVTYTIYNLASNATKTVNLTVTAPGTALPEEVVNIKVIVTSQNNALKKDSVTTTTTIMPGILLADDTNGGDISGFTSALDNASYNYDVKIAEGSTGFSGVLSKYPIVIWVCKGTTTLSDVDKQNLRFYLNGGGNLFISGEDIGYDIAGDIDGFYQNYLHASYIADDANINNLDGVTSDPIGDGFTNINITGSYPSEIGLNDAYASTIFTYTGSTKIATLKADTDTYKVVYFACMYFEGSDTAANKDAIIDRIIKWFKPANDVGVQKINYPVSGNTYDVGEMTINAEIVNYGSNQQSDFNVSCEIEEVIQPAQTTTIFNDSFEVDLSKWTATPAGKWIRSTTYANSGSYSAKCLYDANSTDYNLISNNIDLTSATNADFEYYFRGSSENTYDYLYVEIKKTTDSTWNILTQYTGTTYGSAWNKGSFDILSYVGSTVQVRFRFHTDSSILSGESWYVDDVAVSKTTPPVTQIVYDNNQTITTTLAQYSTKSISWSYNFRNTTDYRINIKTWLATDGAKGNDEETATIKITMSFTFSFKRGWNFITIPVNTTYERAGDLANAINYCTHVMRWNATAQCYETYDKNTGVSNFTIDQGIGYYIYLTEPSDFTVQGSNITSQEVALEQGWNSIGWANDTATTASVLASKINYCTAVAYWNSTLGRYVTYTVGSNISDFRIEKGMSCFVYVTEASVWKNG